MITSPRGFTLLVALIFVSIILSVGLALTDVSIKQFQLGTSAKASQTAFYNADGGLECALYWDQQDAFDYSGTYPSNITCQGTSLQVNSISLTRTQRELSFALPCATITIYKQSTGSASIYSDGSSCGTGSLIIRGIKASY